MAGHLARRRQQVVEERRRERVAVGVVAEVLEQHAADPLDDATEDLPFHDLRVDHPSAVLGDDVPQ